MTYIKYDKTKKVFYATGKRPGNQNHPKVLKKIASRLRKYVFRNANLCLTHLQNRFVEQVDKIHEKKPWLSAERIDIAHHIAISRIIKAFVDMLNNPKNSKVKEFKTFTDDICSTGYQQTTIRVVLHYWIFLELLIDDADPEYLCGQANEIIDKLNCCTRNLIPGHKSVNRAIGQAKDPHLVAEKGKPGSYQETSPSVKLSKIFSRFCWR